MSISRNALAMTFTLRLTWIAAATLLLGACSQGADKSKPESDAPLSEALFFGAATDEALERLLALPAKDVASERVIIDSPTASAILSKDTPAPITFRLASEAHFHAPRPSGESAVSAKPRSVLREISKFISPIGVAHAHGEPFSGRGFLLSFSSSSRRVLLRVFTSEKSYKPDIDAWTALASAPQPVTLTITSAVFESNAILTGAGPFIGANQQLGIE